MPEEQEVQMDAPVVRMKRPAGHWVQMDEPVEEAKRPAAQLTQDEDAVAPVVATYVPVLQSEQSSCVPVVAVYLPAVQLVQTAAAKDENDPAGQLVHDVIDPVTDL